MQIVSRSDAKSSGLNRYFTGASCRRGHVSERYLNNGECIECHNAVVRAATAMKPKREKKPAIDRVTWNREYGKRYRDKNKKKLNDRNVAEKRERRKNDPVFAIAHRVRRLIGKSFSEGGFSKGTKTSRILGCDWEFFRLHIERQFLPGMTWENRADWHLDHIVAVSTATTEADVLALNHFTNLRPLWKPDNLAKGARQTHLI